MGKGRDERLLHAVRGLVLGWPWCWDGGGNVKWVEGVRTRYEGFGVAGQ